VSARDTTGVNGVARILASLSDGSPRTVPDLAREVGLARSTAFDLVRRLQEARLIAREPTGKLVAGPVAIALSFSRFGLARLHGPAEALLSWLRDHCDATATLSCVDRGERVTLASFLANRPKSAAADRATTLTYAICGEGGLEVARLDVVCRPNASRSERSETELLALRAKASLEHHLRDESAQVTKADVSDLPAQ
jgi:DNA-binding IclR family transcriptional regulator